MKQITYIVALMTTLVAVLLSAATEAETGFDPLLALESRSQYGGGDADEKRALFSSPEVGLLAVAEPADVPEVSNYDSSVPVPFCACCTCYYKCFCVNVDVNYKKCRLFCFGKRRRSAEQNEDFTTELILGSEEEMKFYKWEKGRRALLNSKVIRAERYERPLATDVAPFISKILDGKQSCVLVTLTDGRKFMVVKGNQWGVGSKTIIILANHMTSDWVKSGSKEISKSTLGDFVKAGGPSYHVVSDNGNHAAIRMMELS